MLIKIFFWVFFASFLLSGVAAVYQMVCLNWRTAVLLWTCSLNSLLAAIRMYEVAE